jgi:hypothetical protein
MKRVPAADCGERVGAEQAEMIDDERCAIDAHVPHRPSNGAGRPIDGHLSGVADSIAVEARHMDARLAHSLRALQVALGLTATLAGLDKFFNLLADWGAYVSPAVAAALPFSVATFMGIIGVIEFAVGVTILALAPRIGAYVASLWLLLIAVNLIIGGHLDIAGRDVVMSLAAFAVARFVEVQSASRVAAESLTPTGRVVTA